VAGRYERVVKNQDAFRRVNDDLAAVARALDEDERTPFLCECARERCTQVVLLTLDEYEDVRSDNDRFLIAPGHPLAADERVLEESDRYWIAEKNGHEARHIPTSI
jgi:hypothetical protein